MGHGGTLTTNQPTATSPRIATVVEDSYVEEVRDGDSGLLHRSVDYLRQEENALTRLRASVEDLIAHETPRLQCGHCGVAVRLRLSTRKNWFFRHVEDDGSCRYQSQGAFSQAEFDARRYNGQKEGPLHRTMKRLILRSLHCDPAVDQSSIKEEMRWTGKHQPGTWRRPDVHAIRAGVRIAFEVQLSSTYINVMRERRRFYLEEGGLLFWILTSISESERRQFENDVLYPNNCNVFAVDEDTLALSQQNRDFVLRCGYLRPVRDGWRVLERWEERLVPFSDLTADAKEQRVFAFDYDKVRRRIQDEVRIISGVDVLKVFQDQLLPRPQRADWDARWRSLKKLLPRELMWPKDNYGHHFFDVVGLYLSAREGRPIGWRYPNLIQVAHWCADSAPYLLPYCIECFHAFDRGEVLNGKVYGAKWATKLRAVAGRDFSYQIDQYLRPLSRYREALNWLLPEVRAGLDRTFGQLPDYHASTRP